MSWKGFRKGVSRAPQQVKERLHLAGEITHDDKYDDVELRFTDIEANAKKLKEETNKYFLAINGMLDHQIEFAKACAQIYNPISGRASDPNSFVVDTNPEGIRAAEEYIAIVNELKASLSPELDMIKARIVAPAQELMEMVKVFHSWCVSRKHKRVDYDRRKNAYEKLKNKADRSAKEESELYKAEGLFEEASEVYVSTTEFLKERLQGFVDDSGTEHEGLFDQLRNFVVPLFQSFYYMQLNVFYTLHETMQSIDIGYFDLTRGIEEAFEAKRGDVQQQVEAIAICRFKTTGKPKPSRLPNRLALQNGRPGSLGSTSRKTLEGSTSRLAIEDRKESDPAGRRSHDSYDNPPPYQNGESGLGRSASTGADWASAARNKAAPPPPKPKPSRLGGAAAVETVTALYDYEAQAEDDLSFGAGDTIEVVSRTDNENEWWIGKIGARQGQFPGNYVQLDS